MKEHEKRRYKRLDINLTLNISNLFKQDNVTVAGTDAPIHVVNISKGGLGFQTTATLPIGYYFNAKIKLGNEDSMLYTVVRIIRSELDSDGSTIYYGAEFIGLAPILDYIFDNYESNQEETVVEQDSSQ